MFFFFIRKFYVPLFVSESEEYVKPAVKLFDSPFQQKVKLKLDSVLQENLDLFYKFKRSHGREIKLSKFDMSLSPNERDHCENFGILTEFGMKITAGSVLI